MYTYLKKKEIKIFFWKSLIYSVSVHVSIFSSDGEKIRLLCFYSVITHKLNPVARSLFSSNCVINLSPDKRAVLKEAYSVMKVHVTPQTSGSQSFLYRSTVWS